MNVESFTAAIRHIWSFLIPPLLNLVVITGLIAAGWSTSCGGTASNHISVSAAAPVASVSRPEGPKPPADATEQKQRYEEWDKILTSVQNAFDLKDKDFPKILEESVNILGHGFSFLGEAAKISFAALLYVVILLLAIMLVVDLITRSVSDSFSFFVEISGLGKLTEVCLRRAIRRLSGMSHILGVSKEAVLRFESIAIADSPATVFIRARLSSQDEAKNLSNYELHEISLAWLSTNAANTQWKLDRSSQVGRLEVMSSVIKYTKTYIILSISILILELTFGCVTWRPLTWIFAFIVVWAFVRLAVVLSKRRLMRSDIEAYRFYRLAA